MIADYKSWIPLYAKVHFMNFANFNYQKPPKHYDWQEELDDEYGHLFNWKNKTLICAKPNLFNFLKLFHSPTKDFKSLHGGEKKGKNSCM